MNPADVKSDFASGLNGVISFYATAKAALSGDKDKTLLAENIFLTAAVQWEGFISDLILAYVNRDSTRFGVHLRDALETEGSRRSHCADDQRAAHSRGSCQVMRFRTLGHA
jgi:hypothetical protein